ncbi:MAG TPA: sigma-70 family RNA polymerase sigma factor [Ilumatobacteraceae bacterium]
MTDLTTRRVADFESLVRVHDGALRAFAYRLVGRECDDVLQVAYIAAFRALPGFRDESAVSTWLHRIVYTTAMNHLRSRRRRLHRDDAAIDDVVRDDVAVFVSNRVDVARALARLPLDQRAALLLVDAQGFSYDDAARVLDVAPGTVASRLNRARHRLRELLDLGKDD